MVNDDDNPTQRALVFQGGGALGAYEAGVFKSLYERLKSQGPHLFDVVAGTSAGAINAAILVSYVKENNGSWDGAAERLKDFWTHISSPTPPLVESMTRWWNDAARRYYSTKEAFLWGANNVFSLPRRINDERFFDNFPVYSGLPNTTVNTWYLYSNTPLRESLTSGMNKQGKRGFVNFPIATNFDSEFVDPRLLVVAVDIELGKTVIFDSYAYYGTKCHICDKKIIKDDDVKSHKELHKELLKHVYNDHRGMTYHKEAELRWSVYGEVGKKISLYYDQGIDLKHVMASSSVPISYDYEKIGGRKFWDGGIMSNTPLREMIQAHRDYWLKGRDSKVPDLDVYIVNVWSKTDKLGLDYDGAKDRRNDLLYCDKTEYDLKVSELISDYVELTNELIDLGKRKGVTDKEIEEIKDKFVTSFKRSKEKRKFRDITEGRFKIQKVEIERQDDQDSISNKWADYTSETISKLIEKGEEDGMSVPLLS